MPEGDILHRTAARLDAALSGRVLVGAELRWPTAAEVELTGRVVLGTRAYGKHLFTSFDDGRSLHTHLRMEGSWRLSRSAGAAAAREMRNPFVRAVLATPEWTAIGLRLGMLDVVPTRDEHHLIGHLGPDVLAHEFATSGLREALTRMAAEPQLPVAEALLEQRLVAGIGTIYAAESMFSRRLWPWTPVAEVTDLPSLLMTAHALMARSVAADTPTATGETRRGLGTQVHGRAGRPCRRCGTPVAVGHARQPPMERPIFYCPVCQAARSVSRPG